MNLILVRRRNETLQGETRQEDLPEESHEARNDINNNDIDNNSVVDKQVTNLRRMIKILNGFCIYILKLWITASY